MEPTNEVPSRQNEEATIKLLAQLTEKLYCGDMSKARRAAHNLSWMQEAGFEVLKNALLDKSSIGTKISAAYGLRSMRGRMKKMALEVLLQGLKSPNDNTRRVCTKTALILTKKSQPKPASGSARGGKPFSTSDIVRTSSETIPPKNISLQNRPVASLT